MEIAQLKTPLGNDAKVFYSPQPHFEVNGPVKASYRVRFSDGLTGHNYYDTTIETNHFAAAGPKYYVPWLIEVEENGSKFITHKQDLAGKRVLVMLSSTALGDTIGWMPAVERFRLKHGCEVTVRAYWNNLFEANYPNLKFEAPEPLVKYDHHACYVISCQDNDPKRYENKAHWRSVPLQQIATDFLGLDHKPERAKIVRSPYPSQVTGKYVAISEGANGYLAKRWIHPGGWQKVVDHLVGLGYKVVSVSTEPTELKNVLPRNGRSIEKTIRTIQHADLFIGCDSGPSWLAWSLGVPTVVISGFSASWGGAPTPYRVINESVCHGCINDPSLPLDRNALLYCPRGKELICSKAIAPEAVIEQVNRALAGAPVAKELIEGGNQPPNAPAPSGKRVLIILPHCSTGGCPQYCLTQAQDLLAAGMNVAAVEVRNYGPLDVQRKKFQALLGDKFHQAGGDGNRMLEFLVNFNPDVVHLHESPENMFSAEIADKLFAKPRSYRIVQTLHSSEFGPDSTKYWPDAYAFVSRLGPMLFSDACKSRDIPYSIVEYHLPKRVRPDRVQALQALGLDPNRKHVLSVGLFAPWKNQAEVWEVARRLPHISFHSVGNQADNFKDYWQPLMNDKPANVTVWGEREDVDKFYASMDVMLFPSTKECWPLAVVEALSWQVPVLMRNLPVYFGGYDSNPLITFISSDVDQTAFRLQEMLPSMSDRLLELYA
jgi:autotransporter strand-loop-strand O-heptosyltransferase